MVPRVTGGALLFALAASAGLLAGPMAADANAGGRVTVGVSIGGGYCGPRSFGGYGRSHSVRSYYRPSYYRPAFYGSSCGPVYRPIVVAPAYCGPRYPSYYRPRHVYSSYAPAYSTTIIESETYGARFTEPEPIVETAAPTATFASYRQPSSVERETVERRTVGGGRETVEREVIETRYPRPRPSVEVIPPAPRDSITESYERLIDRGWDAITDDYSSGALDRFARAYRLRPSDAEPRIGYAVASALRSDDRTAIWSMRKAFEVDPRGAAIPSGGIVDRRVERVAHRYEDFIERRERRGRRPDADDLFMAAATRYLLGDLKTARIAIEQIYSSGCEESTRNLRDLICREDATGSTDGKPEPRHD